jgi:hypothetical protein
MDDITRDIEIKAQELQENILRRDEECRPINTTRTYGHCHKEWREWCQTHSAPLPAIWPPATPWPSGDLLPGDLVCEQKLMLFMDFVTNRPLKKGRRLQQALARQAAAALALAEDAELCDDKGDLNTIAQVTMKYNSARGYLAALQVL